MIIEPKGDYPNLWKRGLIQRRMYARADWRCEHCGMEFEPGTTRAKTARRKDGAPITLTIHHLDGNKYNCSYANLLSCCQVCHLHIQSLWSPGMCLPLRWERAPEWITKRGLAFKEHPQMRLAL